MRQQPNTHYINIAFYLGLLITAVFGNIGTFAILYLFPNQAFEDRSTPSTRKPPYKD